ncbi:MAG: thioredoxin domain-containing protein, partial [Melioribacteraceae bacterium]
MDLNNPKPNRLINEKSPYLLQHAYNPVDWYPWNSEAFEKAEREDKPVFLSIGYSTCHWCHVMEHESFEDEETALLMNQTFVSIKVDREERPDIDNIYMMVCQIMNGTGGWPLSIIMTPDKKPFFSGTYFPKESKYGRIGLKDLIMKIDDAWKTKRKDIEESAEEITNYLKESYPASGSEQLSSAIFNDAFLNFEKRFDSTHGGFGTAPKFPSPHNLMFLLRYWKRTGTQQALEMVTKTLIEMRHGGIFDQVGFGFHRYSTDAKWLVPHFEKMLYDQALLLMAYTEAYQTTGNGNFKKTADEIVTYILRDMTSADGGFYSAEDADSEGVEGKFYLWTQHELIELLG